MVSNSRVATPPPVPHLEGLRIAVAGLKKDSQQFNIKSLEELERCIALPVVPDFSQLKARVISVGNGRLTHPALRKIYAILVARAPEEDIVELIDGNGRSYPVSKPLGQGCSNYLNTLLTNGMRESSLKMAEVKLDEYSADAVQVVYDYMTSGTADKLNQDNLLEVYSCARFLQMAELEEICWNFIANESFIKGDNIWDCIDWASTHSEERLQNKCLSFLKTEEPSNIAPHPCWKALTPKVVQFFQRDLKIGIHFLRDGSTSVTLREPAGLQESDKDVLEALNIKELSLHASHLPLLSLMGTTSIVETLTISSSERCDVKLLGKFLSTNRTIQHLFLSDQHLGDEGARILAESLLKNQSLRCLCLSRNHIGDKGAEALGKMLEQHPSLIELDLQHNRISPKGAKAFAKKLQKNGCLTSLNLDHNAVGDKGTESFAKYLKHNRKLTVLSLINNQITVKGALALADLFSSNPVYTALSLGGNAIGDQGLILLAEKLKKIIKLKSINLSQTQLSDVSLGALMELLQKSPARCDVSGNRLSFVTAKVLAEALKSNSNIQDLNLSDNRFGPEGAAALGDMLAKNRKLRILHFKGNQIEDQGAIELASRMRGNVFLTDFDLGSNAIGDAGASALAQMIKDNQTLRSLSLANNSIGDPGVKALVSAMDHHPGLELTIISNAYGEEGRTALSDAHIFSV